MFGTYIRRGEWIVYPFFEYYRDDDFEYKPEELGYPGEVDYLGRYRASEGLLFLAYGLGENLAIEVEAAYISASFEKAAGSLRPAIAHRGVGPGRRRGPDPLALSAGERASGRSSSATSRR